MANYLFNGVELPQLPEWDKGTYPYAYIFKPIVGAEESGQNKLLLSTVELLHQTGAIYDFMHGAADGECICYSCAAQNDTEWELTDTVYTVVTGEAFYVSGRLVWANTDVYDRDGATLYLAASDPIPVTTAPAPDATSMVMGWLVGRAIAGQRGKEVVSVTDTAYVTLAAGVLDVQYVTVGGTVETVDALPSDAAAGAIYIVGGF